MKKQYKTLFYDWDKDRQQTFGEVEEEIDKLLQRYKFDPMDVGWLWWAIEYLAFLDKKKRSSHFDKEVSHG